MNTWKKTKITVVKKFLAEDLAKELIADEIQKKGFAQCSVFEQGQEFILEKPDKPANFCSWAWADIHKDLIAIMGGASFPWINREGAAIACCTDGFRPVVFKIERV